MDGAGDELLASARLPGDQHRGVGRGDALDIAQDLREPREELARLAGYLGIAMDWDRVASVVQRPSLVTRQARDITKDRGEVLAGWRRAFCAAQIARARELVAQCGLGDLWDACGSERRDGAQAMPAEQRAWRLP